MFFRLCIQVHSKQHVVICMHTLYGIEMQDNYIAVHFQRSFHDMMGGGRKFAVEFSSSSSSVRLPSHISSMMRLQFKSSL